MEQDVRDLLGSDVADWVEEFGGEEFKKALTEAQLAAIRSPEGEEEVPEEEGEEASRTRLQSVAERLERKVATSTPRKAETETQPEEEERKAAKPTEQLQPIQITEEHLRQWLGDEWDAMTPAQQKVAMLNYYNYVVLSQVVQALQSLAEDVDKRFEEIVAASEEDEAVEELTNALIDAASKAGLSEEEMEEVARLMSERQILDPTVAVEYYILRKNLSRTPLNVGERSVRRASTPAPTSAAPSAGEAEEEVSSFAEFVRKVLPKTEEGRQLIRRIPI